MEIGLIGLGKMGKSIARRLALKQFDLVVFDRDRSSTIEIKKNGAKIARTISQVATLLHPPRIIWLMVPHDAVSKILFAQEGLMDSLQKGDIVLDGGNSNFRTSKVHAKMLQKKGIAFLDVGTSGGLGGEKMGFTLMVGGNQKAYEKALPIFAALGAKNGYAYVGASGAGHFVKMVHNAIEYGMMESLAEGVELLSSGPFDALDLRAITEVWRHGSIIRSHLVDLTSVMLAENPTLRGIAPYVEDTGEGRWAVEEALKAHVPFWANTAALFTRFRSRQEQSYAAKFLAALRAKFGGHRVRKK